MTARGPRVVPAMLFCALLLALLASPAGALAQQQSGTGNDEREERERAFIEAVRAQDPAAAERFIGLRDAREHAIDELKKVEARYIAVGPELRPAFLPDLKQARRKYAVASLAMLDFLDERDRQALARYQEETNRVNRLLDERRKSRAEIEKLLND